jgi:hypothetical protein
MNPDETTPPNAPEPETNPVPPPEPQPEQSAEPPAPAVAAPAANTGTPNNASPFPSAFALFKPSWAAVKLNFWTFFGIGIAPLVLAAAAFLPLYSADTSFNNGSLKGTDFSLSAASIVLWSLFIIVSLFIAPALSFIQVLSAQGKKVSISEAVRGGRHFFWRWYGTMIVAGIMILGGLILLIVPGIFMIRRYFLAPYALISEDLTISQTLDRCKQISKQYGGAIWGLLGVTLLIGLVGVIPILGSIISFIANIIYYCAPAIRWEQLRKLGPASVKA